MPKRILVTGAAKIGKAGVASIVYKWGQEFDNTQIIYDYLMQSGLPDDEFQKNIKAKGGRMFTMPPQKRNKRSILKWIETIVRKYNYDTIHINTDSAYVAAGYIYAAKKGGIKKIYVHSHSTDIDDNNEIKRQIKILIHKLCRPYVVRNTRMYLACSSPAGEWMFGKGCTKSKRYRIVYNGIEVKPYLFDSNMRDVYRNELGINGKFVLCNIGRFSYPKNHHFLIDLFYKYQKQNENSVLLLVGEGELLDDVKSHVASLGISDKVLFLGIRDDVPAILSTADCLVMPSRFEGLPVTMVEAQMSDLPCVISGNITREAKFTDNVTYVDDWKMDNWCKKINKFRDVKREKNYQEKKESMFNIENSAKELAGYLLL